MQNVSSSVCLDGVAEQSLLLASVGFSRELNKLVAEFHFEYM